MSKNIIIFSHIPKCGGVTMNYILRRHFGLKHIETIQKYQNNKMIFNNDDLLFQIKINPFVNSIAGHGFACLDINRINIKNKNLLFYTMLRNPIDRVFSQYRFQVKRYNLSDDFNKWFQEYHISNGIVKHIAGSNNLGLAMDILSNNYQAVGLMEKYDESLLIFKQRLSLQGINLHYKIKNVTNKSERDKEIEYKYKDMVISNNLNDIKLYEFVLNTIWENQIDDYNLSKLEADLSKEFCTQNDHLYEPISSHLKVGLNRAYRNVFYKPIDRLRYRLRNY